MLDLNDHDQLLIRNHVDNVEHLVVELRDQLNHHPTSEEYKAATFNILKDIGNETILLTKMIEKHYAKHSSRAQMNARKNLHNYICREARELRYMTQNYYNAIMMPDTPDSLYVPGDITLDEIQAVVDKLKKLHLAYREWKKIGEPEC